MGLAAPLHSVQSHTAAILLWTTSTSGILIKFYSKQTRWGVLFFVWVDRPLWQQAWVSPWHSVGSLIISEGPPVHILGFVFFHSLFSSETGWFQHHNAIKLCGLFYCTLEMTHYCWAFLMDWCVLQVYLSFTRFICLTQTHRGSHSFAYTPRHSFRSFIPMLHWSVSFWLCKHEGSTAEANCEGGSQK